MKVQKISQSTIYQTNSRYKRSADVLQNCCPKPKLINQTMKNGMLSFKGKIGFEPLKPLVSKMGVFMKNTCSLIMDNYSKSKIKAKIVAPLQEKWSDFTYKMPRISRALKSSAIVTAFVTALDSGK